MEASQAEILQTSGKSISNLSEEATESSLPLCGPSASAAEMPEQSEETESTLQTQSICECHASNSDDSDRANQLRKETKKKQKKVAEEDANEKKPKLRTSKDVYDRLKWDSTVILIRSKDNKEEALDISTVFVGYKDRFLGMCELPIDEFQPGGEIPFHRVYYFRTGGPPILPFVGENGEVKVREDNLPKDAVFIWDRDTRIDLVFMSGNSSRRGFNNRQKIN